MYHTTEITEKGMRNFHIHLYRTKDGQHLFEFKFAQQTCNLGDYFEIIIITQPSYEARANGYAITHRLPSKSMIDKAMVCIATDKLIEATGSLDKARSIAIGWAEMTSKYILTGKTIDKQVNELHGPN